MFKWFFSLIHYYMYEVLKMSDLIKSEIAFIKQLKSRAILLPAVSGSNIDCIKPVLVLHQLAILPGIGFLPIF